MSLAVPGYQKFMYPFLSELKDVKERTLQEMYLILANHFDLTEDEREELLPSGNQRVFHNRIGWARTYLNKAGLIKTVRRATFCITEEGEAVLSNPEIKRIDNAFLMRYESFRDFKGVGKINDNNKMITNNIDTEKTPRELLDENYKLLKEETTNELLVKIFENDPSFFEKLVVDLLVTMGYGGSIADAGRAIGKSGDEGIDGVIKEDVLGLDVIYIQAKRWRNTVSRPEIQKFVGSLEGKRAKKGVFISTSNFSDGAHDYVSKIDKKIILIDGELLTDLMFKYDVGVSQEEVFVTKKIDLDYFES